jgi:hypothetical protein
MKYILFISIIIGFIIGQIVRSKYIYHGANSNILKKYKYYINGECYHFYPVRL